MSLRRSVELLRSFRLEQTEPERFYRLLGADLAQQVAAYAPVSGAVVLDVGGGPGWAAQALEELGARCVVVDPDLGELRARSSPGRRSVAGDGRALPVLGGSVDICVSSNVLEHVAEPEALADELLRVTRPGGTVLLSYTCWLSFHGGHETRPYHLLLGGRRAADRYARIHGRRPKNDYGVSLFPWSAGRMLRWARRRAAEGGAELVARLPRYHPRWARWVVAVPGLRELASWNVLLVLRRR